MQVLKNFINCLFMLKSVLNCYFCVFSAAVVITNDSSSFSSSTQPSTEKQIFNATETIFTPFTVSTITIY